jgi:hypothetical protein
MSEQWRRLPPLLLHRAATPRSARLPHNKGAQRSPRQGFGLWNFFKTFSMLRWSRVAVLCLSPARGALLSGMRPCIPPHPSCIPTDELRKDITVTHSRAGGPGGQHRNKVNTAVTLKHTPTEVVAAATESRSQKENLKKAMVRLRVRMALQLRTDPPPTSPSALWSSRSKGGKLTISESHDDFPAVLAEALDCIWATRDVKSAAEVSLL